MIDKSGQKMFEVDQTVGIDCDYPNLKEAMSKIEPGIHLLLKPGEHKFDETVLINKNVALQSDHEEEFATVMAPEILFDAGPEVFMVVTHVRFVGHVVISGGSTVCFEGCEFSSTNEEFNSILQVKSSAPTFRMCRFYDFSKHAIEYLESRGGICTDCIFENIRATGDPIIKGPGAKPFHEHNKVK